MNTVLRMASQAGVLGLEFLDLQMARSTGLTPRTMPVLMIEVTKRCNLRCSYCGYPDYYPDRGEELTTDEIKAILRDCIELKTRVVSFGGGEPFLRPDFIELVAYTRSLGLHVHINSNGILVDQAKIEAIPDGPDVNIIFSLDHPDAEVNDAVRGPGSHAGVIGAARMLHKMRPRISVGINCVVGGHNIDSLGKMVDLTDSLGGSAIKFLPLHQNLAHRWRYHDNPVVPNKLADSESVWRAIRDAATLATARRLFTSSKRFVDMVRLFPDSLPPYDCWAGYVFGNIDPYGYLFPCYEIMDDSLNVRTAGLAAAWRSPAMAGLRTRVRNCQQPCLCAGAAEASFRMDVREIVRDPVQLYRDFSMFFGDRGRGSKV